MKYFLIRQMEGVILPQIADYGKTIHYESTIANAAAFNALDYINIYSKIPSDEEAEIKKEETYERSRHTKSFAGGEKRQINEPRIIH